MIEPKDGEWWMVEHDSGDKRVMRYWLRDGDSDAVWNLFNLYKPIEKEIDWKGVLEDFGGRADGLTVHLSSTWPKDVLIEFCHEIAEVTDSPE